MKIFKLNPKIIVNAIVFTAGFSTSSVYAYNLMQVYYQALQCDPIYAQAVSTWHSQKMLIPIAEAGYLPQVSIASNATREYSHTSPNASTTNTSSYSWQYGYALSASQAIFNGVVWAQIKGADATVKAATATYLSAQQSLMQRTATAYFAVLLAYDQLRFAIADKRETWRLYIHSNEQFHAGIISITDANDDLASYEQAVTEQVAAENNLNSQIENLSALTGRNYYLLNGLGKHLPLISPKPVNINQWVSVAIKQNYGLIAQNYNVLAAMEFIKQEAAGGYPTLSFQGGVGESHTAYNPPDTATDTASFGLNLAYAPIQGGLVEADTEQARYNYVTASGLLEQTYRTVVNQTRSGFLGVLANITQIKADKKNIIASRAALHSTEGGYKAGTRTMLDILTQLTKLYQAKEQYATDEYAYINNIIALKDAAGTLSVVDLKEINAWLGKSVEFPDRMIVAKMPTPHDHSKIKMKIESHPVKNITVKVSPEIKKSDAKAVIPSPEKTQSPNIQLPKPE